MYNEHNAPHWTPTFRTGGGFALTHRASPRPRPTHESLPPPAASSAGPKFMKELLRRADGAASATSSTLHPKGFPSPRAHFGASMATKKLELSLPASAPVSLSHKASPRLPSREFEPPPTEPPPTTPAATSPKGSPQTLRNPPPTGSLPPNTSNEGSPKMIRAAGGSAGAPASRSAVSGAVQPPEPPQPLTGRRCGASPGTVSTANAPAWVAEPATKGLSGCAPRRSHTSSRDASHGGGGSAGFGGGGGILGGGGGPPQPPSHPLREPETLAWAPGATALTQASSSRPHTAGSQQPSPPSAAPGILDGTTIGITSSTSARGHHMNGTGTGGGGGGGASAQSAMVSCVPFPSMRHAHHLASVGRPPQGPRAPPTAPRSRDESAFDRVSNYSIRPCIHDTVLSQRFGAKAACRAPSPTTVTGPSYSYNGASPPLPPPAAGPLDNTYTPLLITPSAIYGAVLPSDINPLASPTSPHHMGTASAASFQRPEHQQRDALLDSGVLGGASVLTPREEYGKDPRHGNGGTSGASRGRGRGVPANRIVVSVRANGGMAEETATGEGEGAPPPASPGGPPPSSGADVSAPV